MSRVRVGIIDYGLCNLDSMVRAVAECGGAPFLVRWPEGLEEADHVILPGVGAFPDGMTRLQRQGLVEALRDHVVGHGIPLLGVCLGMQLLASTGSEGGQTEGLGWIPGRIEPLEPEGDERTPHIGWNNVEHDDHFLFEGVESGRDFYFVHSFHFCPESSRMAIAETPYCGKFVSAVAQESVLGVQFHPEKSQKAGFRILRNFLAWKGC